MNAAAKEFFAGVGVAAIIVLVLLGGVKLYAAGYAAAEEAAVLAGAAAYEPDENGRPVLVWKPCTHKQEEK